MYSGAFKKFRLPYAITFLGVINTEVDDKTSDRK